MKDAGTGDLLRRVRGLYEGGSVVGLSDAELLRRFAERGESDDAEAAFEALVTRHGPMVLGVCRRALGDAAEADDAFQATFLVLVRRAPSVRVDDSLGRWLYGVATRVARKAAARPRRDAPLKTEPEAPAEPDRRESLSALDEELLRLPEKYRSPILLCHLEGLSHAEAADRLRWPVGTLSGRLSRARGLLKDRLERRGVAGPADALAIPWRAALPDGLIQATARAAAGAAGPSAAALAAAVGVGWSTAPRLATALLLAAAGVLVVPAAGRGTIPGREEPGPATTAPARPGPSDVSPHFRTAQAIVDEIEQRLLIQRSLRKQGESIRQGDPDPFHRADREIPGLVLELRTAYPDDPRGVGYLLDRWWSLHRSGRAAEASDEAAGFVGAADAGLARDARYFLATAALYHGTPVDGPTAVAVARDAARGLGDDPRIVILLDNAAGRLEADARTRLGLLAILGLATAVALVPRRWWRAGLVASLWAAGLLAFVVVAARSLAGEWFDATADHWYRLATTPQRQEWWRLATASYASFVARQLRVFLAGPRGWLAMAAAVSAATLAAARLRRKAAEQPPHPGTARGVARWFVATLAAALAVDAAALETQRRMLAREILRDHPDSWRARLVQGEARRAGAIGRPFELEFDDAITGRHVAMKDLRGKVVVVEFWATWCGRCVVEVPQMLALYHEYRGRGVEFIGVSLGDSEEDGGLADLREFVAAHGVPWPQYPQGPALGDLRTGLATGSFSESWGVKDVPTVFIIDAEGRLDSTNARGRLDALIPKLLDARDASRR